jgi:hypothetical protein
MTESDKVKRRRAQAQVRIARLDRLPGFARRLIADRKAARAFVEASAFGRVLFAAGISPTPGMGLPEFDACVALVKDALGITRLSDAAFEHALRLSTPPKCRETAQ